MSSSAGGMKKTAWPEVKGMSAAEAAKIIKRDMPEANIVFCTADEDGTMELVLDRVDVVLDTVAVTPTELAPTGSIKSSWPEVVGMSIEDAKETILRSNNVLEVVAVPLGAPDDDGELKPNRVRLFVNTVDATPFVG
ncbi:hypothetical protein PR202_gb28799 [Eleusine coracana subsp. coracana]|uniref:Uncharacterized protein n=1 Tax=Eleusine coracana subsp. coracana TaxID=191504 RepID=A0AAV5FXW2_ELECO|nr:hypothetical protein QOZ80_8BG0645020 [Eleusine coracana subsp. coracana]GJN39666.1 hypothetical protein PR202_gb28799 [Eleusine coracana subsp. coracana]